MTERKKKLIEVGLPLEKINAESAREKSIRHGHPSTLHLWWSRKPTATARAVLFAQLVDDPSAHPDRFATVEEQDAERTRLHEMIEALVVWENTAPDDGGLGTLTGVAVMPRGRDGRELRTRQQLWAAATEEIRWSNGGELPAVLDPFAGGGTIPLEAQRLGLEAHASDLNPVAVLINKALIEIPPKFAGRAPVHPGAETRPSWRGATGLAEDVRYYGQWMRDEAFKRIGHLYPKVTDDNGVERTVIAWKWARTVRSPNPANPIEVPLVSSWWLGKKKGKEAWVKASVVDGRVRYEVMRNSDGPKGADDGTVSRTGAVSVADGTAISLDYIRAEAKAGRMGAHLIAVVGEGERERVYLTPTIDQVSISQVERPTSAPSQELPEAALGFRVQNYGMRRWSDLFTNRQLVAMTTFSDLVAEARERVLADALAAECGGGFQPVQGAQTPSSPHGLGGGSVGRAAAVSPAATEPRDAELARASEATQQPVARTGVPLAAEARLEDGGSDAAAYSDAVATYLALGVSRLADIANALCRWEITKTQVRNLFTRQAISMMWDFAETQPFSEAAGGFLVSLGSLAKVLDRLPASSSAEAGQADATTRPYSGLVVSTDPPYYDNIGYSDLSDFFYVWLRRCLQAIQQKSVATVLTPKADELVANPYRHDGKEGAEEFFVEGFNQVFHRVRQSASATVPMTVYYAYKQQDADSEGAASTGWTTLLDGLIRAGWEITATWPVRSELSNRMRSLDSNALASSIVLACRPRPEDASATTRRAFLAMLKAELPEALRAMMQGAVAPVDLAQAAIGPGISIFSRYSRVREPDGSDMPVREALTLINATLDEVMDEQESDFDPDTRFAVKWYRTYGWGTESSGTADTLSRATGTSPQALERGGIFEAKGGKANLLPPKNLEGDWDPASDDRTSVWETVVRLAAIMAKDGADRVASLMPAVGAKVSLDMVKELGFLLFHEAEKKGDTADAILFNSLVSSWSDLGAQARKLAAQPGSHQDTLDFTEEA